MQDDPRPSTSHSRFPLRTADDLHAWSLYRQNLNADLSESAIGMAQRSATSNERPFGHFQLREQTVANILNHPKYGPRLKNQDALNYLRFGLPRVKSTALVSDQVDHAPIDENRAERISLTHCTENRHGLEKPRFLNPVIRDVERGGASVASESLAYSDVDEEAAMYRNPVTTRPPVFSDRMYRSNPDLLGMRVTSRQWPNNNQYLPQSPQRLITNDYRAQAATASIDGRQSRHTPVYGASKRARSELDIRRGSPVRPPLSSPVPSELEQSRAPHLLVRNFYFELDRTSNSRRVCGAQRQKIRIIDNVSFDVRAGEVLGIMTTNEQEGSAILEVLANRHHSCRCRCKCELILNGLRVSPSQLAKVAGFARPSLDLCPRMSTRQTMFLHSLLRSPGRPPPTRDTKQRVDELLEELGLSEVRHTSVAQLSNTEKARLLIALQLLLDTPLLLLDQPFKSMDLFDSFFLLEYLRRWASAAPRCVILSVQPPTQETFTMLSKVLLLSTGRTVYFGRRAEMRAYFERLQLVAPPFRNPADYFVDLVTLDNLSSHALLESSDRVERLVAVHAMHLQQRSAGRFLRPPKPSQLPPAIHVHNLAIMFLALCIRSLIFTFPYNVIYLFRNLVIALFLSIITGAIFWQVRLGREQELIWDRVFFYHCLLVLMPLPLFLIEIQDLHREKQYVLSELKMGLYRKSVYFLASLLCSLPGVSLVMLTYALPASSMAAQKPTPLHYMLIMLGYLHTMRFIALSLVWAYDRKRGALISFSFIHLLLAFSSGSALHHKDLSLPFRLLHLISPIRWAFDSLIQWEFASNSYRDNSIAVGQPRYLCSHNPIIQQENAILIKADCGIEYGDHILKWFSISSRPLGTELLCFSIVSLVALFIGAVCFCCCSGTRASSWKRRLQPYK